MGNRTAADQFSSAFSPAARASRPTTRQPIRRAQLSRAASLASSLSPGTHTNTSVIEWNVVHYSQMGWLSSALGHNDCRSALESLGYALKVASSAVHAFAARRTFYETLPPIIPPAGRALCRTTGLVAY